MLGMHGAAYANYAVDDCDFLIALGARFDDRVANVPAKFAPSQSHRPVRHRPRRNRQGRKVQWNHVGLLKRRCGRWCRTPAVRASSRIIRAWHAHIDALKREHAFNYDRNSVAIQPYQVIEEINRLTRGEAIVTTGVGQHQMWAAQYFDFRQPRQWLTSGGMGTMGFGLPAAIGAQIAHPRPAGHRHRWRRQHPHEHR